MQEQREIESFALEVYWEAGFLTETPVEPEKLARKLLGPLSVRFVGFDVLRTHAAALARLGKEWRVYLRKGLPAVERRFCCAHELAEWFLADRCVPDPHPEQSADCLAAALLAPKPFAERACKARGPQWRQLALDFGTTESCAALRFGEITGRPLALVTPTSVRR